MCVCVCVCHRCGLTPGAIGNVARTWKHPARIATSRPTSPVGPSTQVVPNLALNFTFYDGLKHWATEPGQAPSTAASLGCGCFAGFLTSTLTYPLDVVRRRMQVCARSSEVCECLAGPFCGPLLSPAHPATTSRAASLPQISVRRAPSVVTGVLWMAGQGVPDRAWCGVGPQQGAGWHHTVAELCVSQRHSSATVRACAQAASAHTCAALQEAP